MTLQGEKKYTLRLRNRTICTLVRVCLLFFLLTLLPFPAAALDSPHNSTNGMTCDHCHNSAKAAADPDWWKNQQQNVCGQCHNSLLVLGTDVATHLSGTKVLVQSTLCHDPHTQRQNRMWGTSSYLYSSTSDPYTGVTTTTVTKTGANWVQDQWKNMIVLPNVKYQGYSYRIVSNTADTLFIDTEGSAPDNSIDTIYCLPGDTFAIVYGKFLKENINNRLVRFFRDTGTNSFVDDTPTIDGVCQVCHTKTKYFRNSGTMGHPGGVTGTKCSVCHRHDGGFKMNCTNCHGFPPLTTVPTGSDGLANNEGGTGSGTPGAHQKHAVSLGYECSTCHSGGMPESTIYDKQIQIGFNIAGGAYQSGAYAGRALINGYGYLPGNAGTVIQSPSGMTCTVYCHSTGQSDIGGAPDAGAYASPQWNVPATGQCGTCHKTTPGSDSPTSGSHSKHTGPTAAFACTTCHSGFQELSSTHVDGNANVAINGQYGGLSNADGKPVQRNFAGSTCTNTYCHSNVQNNGATTGPTSYATPQWGDAATGACGTCHGPDTGTKISTGSHSKHVAASPAGSNLSCDSCHSGAGPGTTRHADRNIDVSFSSINPSGLYSQSGSNPPGNNYGTCSSTYCHGSAAPQWGKASLSCSGCHEASSNLSNGQTGNNRHSLHYATTTVAAANLTTDASTPGAYIYNCGNCHDPGQTAHARGPAHAGVAAEVKFNVSWATTTTGLYTLGSSTFTDSREFVFSGNAACTNLYCHSNGNPLGGTISFATATWNQTAASPNCGICHAATPSTNKHPMHVSTYGFGCLKCHNATVSDNTTIADKSKHVNGTKDVAFDPFRDSLQGGYPPTVGSYENESCSSTFCHSKGISVATGTVESNSTPTWGAAGFPMACNLWTGQSCITSIGCHLYGYVNAQGQTSNYSYKSCYRCHGSNTPGTLTKASYPSNPHKCYGCHEYPPMYVNNAPKSNEHWIHTYSYGCNCCHKTTTSDGTSITDVTKHANGIYDVVPDPNCLIYGVPLNFTYTFDQGGGTCTNNSCHSSFGMGTATWGNAWIGGGFNYKAGTTCYEMVFTSLVSGGTPPYTYLWDFGDGTTSTEQNPSHVFPSGAVYRVTLTVRDVNRHPGTYYRDLTPPAVNIPPVLNMEVVSVVGYTVTLRDLSYDLDYNTCGHAGQGRMMIYWRDSVNNLTSQLYDLTGSPSNAIFTHTYPSTTPEGVKDLAIYLTDNANTRVLLSPAISVKVPVTATLISPTATAISRTTATLGATLTDDGGSAITERGTVWGTAVNPKYNAVAEGGTAIGTFTQARTGLYAGTKIYYRGYAKNSTTTGYSPNGSFYTEPATQASGVSFTSVDSTDMTVNWTRGSGDGAIVLMRQGSAVATDPADGTYTTYAADTAFGSGTAIGGAYIVSKGTGTSVTVTGLTAGATYYVAVYEYTGTVDTAGVDQGTNYKPTPATGSRATTGGPTLTSPTATAIGSTTATLGANVTSDNGSAITARGTVWGTSANPTGNARCRRRDHNGDLQPGKNRTDGRHEDLLPRLRDKQRG